MERTTLVPYPLLRALSASLFKTAWLPEYQLRPEEDFGVAKAGATISSGQRKIERHPTIEGGIELAEVELLRRGCTWSPTLVISSSNHDRSCGADFLSGSQRSLPEERRG